MFTFCRRERVPKKRKHGNAIPDQYQQELIMRTIPHLLTGKVQSFYSKILPAAIVSGVPRVTFIAPLN
jgi:hypothetical protein